MACEFAAASPVFAAIIEEQARRACLLSRLACCPPRVLLADDAGGGDYAEPLRLLRQEREALEIQLQLTERENARLRQVGHLHTLQSLPQGSMLSLRKASGGACALAAQL